MEFEVGQVQLLSNIEILESKLLQILLVESRSWASMWRPEVIRFFSGKKSKKFYSYLYQMDC
jgi:hypothetical protein